MRNKFWSSNNQNASHFSKIFLGAYVRALCENSTSTHFSFLSLSPKMRSFFAQQNFVDKTFFGQLAFTEHWLYKLKTDSHLAICKIKNRFTVNPDFRLSPLEKVLRISTSDFSTASAFFAPPPFFLKNKKVCHQLASHQAISNFPHSQETRVLFWKVQR